MKLKENDRRFIRSCLGDMLNSEEAQCMRHFVQHGAISTYDHVLSVACLSYAISKRLPLRLDRRSLVVGAFLHDFYLYDWHIPSPAHRLHGFTHPLAALHNAEQRYALTPKERNIIVSHMWPLTITRVPKCPEAVIVCLSDKICALCEFFLKNRSVYSLSEKDVDRKS